MSYDPPPLPPQPPTTPPPGPPQGPPLSLSKDQGPGVGGVPPYLPPPMAPYGMYAAPPATSATAIWSLVLGIISIVLCLGFIAGVPALILGRIAIRDIDASGGRVGGRGVAQGGFITGIIGTVLSALGILLAIVIIIVAAIAANDDSSDAPSCAHALHCANT